ncbi:MAG: glycosyltransferase family 4 protein [Prevotellaceae bacterium]|jgi:glycosyltransferase involved in cell wall biosynthesis|nr:glycosyltransferase family 4 protein [Prevotellaceae bacterium]
MNKIKVILSTNGPLHLIKSAEFLAPLVNIQVIQAWIPKWWNKWIFPIISKIIGRDLSKALKKRTPNCLDGRNHSVALPEFYHWFCRYFLHKNASVQNGKLFGYLSKRYIKNADIFHVRSGSGFSAIPYAKKHGMKVVVDHSIAHPAFMDKQLREEYVKNGAAFDLGLDSAFWQGVITDCEQADCLQVNSGFVRNTFIETGYPADKIQIVYLGVRQDFFSLKKNYEIDKTVKILFTGGFGFRKGGEYLLKALQKLDALNFDYEMTVVGSYGSAKDLIEKYRPKNITFTGYILQDNLKTYLAESDAYLFPSLCEGCASSGMEAMAAGLPVVVTAESGLPINNGENGIVIPSKDENAIVEAIVTLQKDKTLREKLGKNAAKTISENYTWEQYAENTVKIYKSMLEK